jgi:hypothetical protein
MLVGNLFDGPIDIIGRHIIDILFRLGLPDTDVVVLAHTHTLTRARAHAHAPAHTCIWAGDVHGEAGPLFQLLDVLGYDGEGTHPEGRRLVFVGDLVDRGPDSVSVVEFVHKIVSSGKVCWRGGGRIPDMHTGRDADGSGTC